MKILLDGKDLINLAEHSKPVPLEEFHQTLESKGHQIVLSYTNVRELAAPIAITEEVLKVRRLLNAVESLPAIYIREGFIIDDEIRAAATAFEAGAEYSPINPFVRRWDYTFHHGESPARLYINYGLFEIVHSISRRHHALERQMTQRGIRIPSAGIKAFARWVRENPARCPGYRQSYEMYHAIQANSSDIPKDGDIPDMAHIAALPYVDFLTLDRRMMNYATHIGSKLLKNISSPPYQTRLFRSLAEMSPTL